MPPWRMKLPRRSLRRTSFRTFANQPMPERREGEVGPVETDAAPRQTRRFLQIADLRRLRNLQFAARLIVEGFYQGKHRSPFHDYSAEFADYRPYTPGDEIRSIDWRAYARSDRFY